MLVILAAGQLLCGILPLLSLIVPTLEQTRDSQTLMDSFDATRQAPQTHAPVHLWYARTTNNRKRSVVLPKNIIHLSRPNISTLHFNGRFRNGWIRTNAKRKPASKTHYLRNSSTLYLCALFIILVLSRPHMMVLHFTDVALINIATIAYLKDK